MTQVSFWSQEIVKLPGRWVRSISPSISFLSSIRFRVMSHSPFKPEAPSHELRVSSVYLQWHNPAHLKQWKHWNDVFPKGIISYERFSQKPFPLCCVMGCAAKQRSFCLYGFLVTRVILCDFMTTRLFLPFCALTCWNSVMKDLEPVCMLRLIWKLLYSLNCGNRAKWAKFKVVTL